MTLIIDDTHEGQIKIQTLRWAEKELNRVFELAIGDGIVTQGFALRFRIPKQGDEKGIPIQVTIANKEPRTAEQFDKVVEIVRKKKGFKKVIIAATIIAPK